MKRIISLFSVMVATLAAAQSMTNLGSMQGTPGFDGLAAANQAISDKPADYAGYNLLAAALVGRAEQASDARLFAQAEDAVRKSLRLAPNNFDAEKIEASILLGQHEYPAALEAAKTLNQREPDDVLVYGVLTDANVELGNYQDAEVAAQWMLNLRPGNRPALIRAAHLRELFGDAEGAYQLMELAYQSTPPTDTRERALILAEMGHFLLASAGTEAAEKLLRQTLTLFPNCSSGLEELAQIRITQKRYAEAVPLLQQRYQAVPRTDNLYDLAEGLQLASRNSEAAKAFADFETKALAESVRMDNSNRDLVFYYADHAHQPAKALKIAAQEYAWRHDVYTLDAYAWALHVNGQDAEARKQIEAALAVGIHNSTIFEHAGEIALKQGDVIAAERYLGASASLHSSGSEQAGLRLASLGQTKLGP